MSRYLLISVVFLTLASTCLVNQALPFLLAWSFQSGASFRFWLTDNFLKVRTAADAGIWIAAGVFAILTRGRMFPRRLREWGWLIFLFSCGALLFVEATSGQVQPPSLFNSYSNSVNST